MNSIASAENCEQLAKDIFGEEIAYLPWQRPGIDLGIKISKLAASDPKRVGNILGNHGLFNIEYWPLEEEKISRRPKPSPLSGRIALVTGAANGIGAAIVEQFLLGGACVTLADIDANALDEKSQALVQKYEMTMCLPGARM